MPGITITVDITRNSLPTLIAALPELMDSAQRDLIGTIESNALTVVPIGIGPEHDTRLSQDATLLQRHSTRNPKPHVWELVNDALHAGLVYYGNPLSPPRPWFEWALDMSWDWYRGRLNALLAELANLGGR
jgi:hypothetical protein